MNIDLQKRGGCYEELDFQGIAAAFADCVSTLLFQGSIPGRWEDRLVLAVDVRRCAVRDCPSRRVRHSGEHGYYGQSGRSVRPSGNQWAVRWIYSSVDDDKGNLLSCAISDYSGDSTSRQVGAKLIIGRFSVMHTVIMFASCLVVIPIQ